MKNLFTYCFLILSFSVIAQNNFQHTKVTVLPKSELVITGDTNINTFVCAFDTAHLKPSENIGYSQNGRMMHFKNAVLRLNSQGFDCGGRGINKDFQKLIQADTYPEITLNLKNIIFDTSDNAEAEVVIGIAGKQKRYTFPVKIHKEEIPRFTGLLKLNLNDFALEAPKKLFGLIVIKEEVEISFNLIVKPEL